MNASKDILDIYLHYLDLCASEIRQFKSETGLWTKSGSVNNPAGNLALHICGNLRYFIGSEMGGIVYERDREAEFGSVNVPREELLAEIERTKIVLTESMSRLTEADLKKPFVREFMNHRSDWQFVLNYLLAHLSYHVGQISYLRRLSD